MYAGKKYQLNMVQHELKLYRMFFCSLKTRVSYQNDKHEEALLKPLPLGHNHSSKFTMTEYIIHQSIECFQTWLKSELVKCCGGKIM